VPEWLWSLAALHALNLCENRTCPCFGPHGSTRRLAHDMLGLRWNKLTTIPSWMDELEQRGCGVLR
jgi:hypothetical protein